MKLIFLVSSLLFLELNAQNSCCPESDVTETKCIPSEGLNCTNGTVFELDRTAFAEENFYMDGSILVHENGTEKDQFPSDFCLAKALDENGTIHELALICSKNDTSGSDNQFDDTFETTQSAAEPEAKTEAIVFRFLELMSMGCFMLTWLIYLIATKWQDLENQCVLHFLLNYNVVYFSISILYQPKYTFLFGITKAHMIYFFSISSFCWLSLIVFNTWKELTFWHSSFGKTYLIYITYAYGIAVVLKSAVSSMILRTENDEIVDFYDILTDNKLRQRLFYTPIVIVLTVCFLPLVASGILIRRHKYSVIQNNSYIQRLYSSFYINSTLFIIIGLIWLMEIFFSESQPQEICVQSVITTIEIKRLFAIDILNSLQGVFTFILLVVLRKTVTHNLWKSCRLFCSFWMWEPGPIIQPTDELVQQIEQYWNPNVGFHNVRVTEIKSCRQ